MVFIAYKLAKTRGSLASTCGAFHDPDPWILEISARFLTSTDVLHARLCTSHRRIHQHSQEHISSLARERSRTHTPLPFQFQGPRAVATVHFTVRSRLSILRIRTIRARDNSIIALLDACPSTRSARPTLFDSGIESVHKGRRVCEQIPEVVSPFAHEAVFIWIATKQTR